MVQQRRYLIFPALYVVLSYAILFLNRRTLFDAILSERGYYENAGAVAYLAAAALFLVAYLRASRTGGSPWPPSFLALSLLMLVAAGEEASWGQHWLGYQTPSFLADVNRQGEATLHNLQLPLLGRTVVFSQWTSPLFNALWVAFAVALPLVAALSDRARVRLQKWVVVLPWSLGLPFVLNYAILKVTSALWRSESNYLFSNDKRYGINEIRESNTGLLFAVAALYVVLVLLPRRAQRAPADGIRVPHVPANS